MAKMPRGEPRSVPDPAGEQYDEMLRQERLKRRIAEAAEASSASLERLDAFSPVVRPLDILHEDRQPKRTAAVGGREASPEFVYRPPIAPVPSAAELADRRRAIERVNFMLEHPLAGIAYGIASLTGASTKTRDGAMVAGGLADTAMLGAAPRALRPERGLAARAQGQVSPPTSGRDDIRYRELRPDNRAAGAAATITAKILGSGTRTNRRLTPPGWQGHGTRFNEARGHLLAKLFGGLGGEVRNIVTLAQNGANTPQMSGFERQVAQRVRGGEVVEYSATPLYGSETLPPEAVLLTAHGSRGAPAARIIQNPAGRRR